MHNATVLLNILTYVVILSLRHMWYIYLSVSIRRFIVKTRFKNIYNTFSIQSNISPHNGSPIVLFIMTNIYPSKCFRFSLFYLLFISHNNLEDSFINIYLQDYCQYYYQLLLLVGGLCCFPKKITYLSRVSNSTLSKQIYKYGSFTIKMFQAFPAQKKF